MMRHLLLSLLAHSSLTVAAYAADPAADLIALRQTMVRQAAWRSPTPVERRALIEASERLAAAAPSCDATGFDAAKDLLWPVAWTLEAWTAARGTLWVMHERDPHGGALVVMRCGEATDLFLQAPHGTFDVQTDDIVAQAFVHGTARLAAFNTSHRYRATDGETPADPLHPGDVTRQTASAFQAITLAWAASTPSLRVIQVHGFAASTLDADAVLSTGRADRPPKAARDVLASTLALPLSRVRVYGDDVDVLGGTRNVVAKHLAATPTLRFLHIELSRPLRDALAASPEASTALLTALGAASW